MKKFYIFFSIALFLSVIFSVTCWVVPFQDIFNAQDIVVSKANVENYNSNDYGAFVTSKFNKNNSTVDYFLFNAIKLKTVNANIIDKKQVYLGGDAFGFIYKGNGVLVIGKNVITTDSELLDNLKNGELQAGDIICSINGENVKTGLKISEVLNEEKNLGSTVEVKAIRKNKEFTTKIKPAYDVLTKKYKLGVWVKDSMSGIGTLTYIEPDTLRFGALGHALADSSTNTVLGVDTGNIYDCDILGIKRASRGIPGELKGVLHSSKAQGKVDKNCDSGIFGNFNETFSIGEDRELIDIGTRDTVKPGAAQIYTCLDGKNIRPYDIEIIKTSYQSASNQKNLVFKVTDKRLIEETGGIVQGMSGSPIVQNGKLIGAVTHVFINDATKGFGVFIENMLVN